MNLPKSAGVIDFGTLPTSRHHFVINESRIDLFVKLINDLGGRVLRRNQAIPHACLVTRYELADRRNVWQCLRTCLTGHSERVLRADSVSDLWRMQMAAKRLADPSAKIAVVAYEVGYESEAAFSRAFKKVVGRSPTQWRTVSS